MALGLRVEGTGLKSVSFLPRSAHGTFKPKGSMYPHSIYFGPKVVPI